MILDFFRLGVSNLRRRKIRSWLTMIGIFIGIAAVVGLISLGQGLQNAIEQQFENLGKDKIIIQTKTLGPPGSATSESLILRQKDLETVENVNGVEWVIGYLMKTAAVQFKDETRVVFIGGIDIDNLDRLMAMQNFDIVDGRNFKSGDKYKVVLGNSHVYGNMWDKPVKMGDTITIEGQEFKVIGVLSKTGNPFDDQAIYLPKETLKEVLNIGDEESQVIAKTATGFEPSEVADTIERKLRKERGEKEGQETFDVSTAEQLLQSFTNIFAIVQAVLVGIAAISLVVGGIGIMNTMYTAVLERTKEIGTMKAVGAKNSDIALLFLIESGLLGLIGGIIGIAIGVSLGKSAEIIATNYLGTNLLQASFPLWLILGALAFSFFVGSLSGILPALQASKLKPVDALRYE